MSTFSRSLSIALCCAGLSLPATIGRAADSFAGDDDSYNPRASRVQLVSGTDYADQNANNNGAQGSASANNNQNRATTQRTKPKADQHKPAQSQRDDGPQTAHYTVGVVAAGGAAKDAVAPPMPPEDVAPGDADGAAGDASDGPCCEACCCRKGSFCAGFDYLYLRPHFSDNLAFAQTTATTVTPAGGATIATTSNHDVNFPYNYDSDFHVFAGYRTACGEELRVGFWHIQSDASASGSASGNFAGGAGTEVQAPGTTVLAVAGQSLTTVNHLLLNLYDAEDVQQIDGDNSNRCCPAWEINWSYGVRLADFHQSVDTATTLPETLNGNTRFTGAGPRIGFEVRRQIACSKLAAYVSGNAALLMGSVRQNVTDTVPGFLENTVTEADGKNVHIVPNFELAAGISWEPFCCTTVTAGWMLETFTDLGSPAAGMGCTGCGTFSTSMDSGAITSFDGMFVRMEHCF